MKRRSIVVFFLISTLLLLAIPQLSAQNAPSAVIGLQVAGCETQSPQALSSLDTAPGLETIGGHDVFEDQSTSAEIASLTGLNVPGFMGFYNACSSATTVYVYHGENAREELALYHVPIDDFAANLFANWSWDPVNSFRPNADHLIRRFQVNGSATEDTVPFAFRYGDGLVAWQGLLKQTALNLTDASGEKLQPGVYFLQFSTPDFEHSHGSYQSDFRTKYFLNVATATLTLKRSGGQVLVWALDVNSGEAIAWERIVIYGEDAALLASGVTDENGILKLDVSTASGRLLAVLKTEEHFALGYTDWDTKIRPERPRHLWSPPHSQAHVYTDRQVYLPGQKVYFRGIVRVRDDMSYSLPDFKTVSVSIRDAGYNTVQEQEVELNEFGSFHGIFDIGSDPLLGPFQILISRPADDVIRDSLLLGVVSPGFTVAKHQMLAARDNMSVIEDVTHASAASQDSVLSPEKQADEEEMRINLVADKTSYKVGERAKILITSPFEGEAQALVTVERANIISHDLITLNNKSQIYELEILPEHVSHVYVSAIVVKSAGSDRNHPVAAYQMGLTELSVEPEQKILNIDIHNEGRTVLSPGMVTFELRVNDYKGDPVAAELSVALVDPAALSPRPGFDLSLLEAFYGRQRLSVSTSSSLVNSAEGEPGALRFRACCGPCGGGPPDADILVIHDAVFETGYWNPTLRTNADGVTTFELSVPESLPGWSLDVRAISASADGSFLVGEKTFDLTIEPSH